MGVAASWGFCSFCSARTKKEIYRIPLLWPLCKTNGWNRAQGKINSGVRVGVLGPAVWRGATCWNKWGSEKVPGQLQALTFRFPGVTKIHNRLGAAAPWTSNRHIQSRQPALSPASKQTRAFFSEPTCHTTQSLHRACLFKKPDALMLGYKLGGSV